MRRLLYHGIAIYILCFPPTRHLDSCERASNNIQVKTMANSNSSLPIYFPYLEFMHPLELELLGVFLESAQRGKVFHASMKAQRMVEHDERPHTSLPDVHQGRSNC